MFDSNSSYCRNIFFLSMKVMLSKIRWCDDSRFCRNPQNAVVHRGVECLFLDLSTLGLYAERTLVLSLRIQMEGTCLVITTCTSPKSFWRTNTLTTYKGLYIFKYTSVFCHSYTWQCVFNRRVPFISFGWSFDGENEPSKKGLVNHFLHSEIFVFGDLFYFLLACQGSKVH